ncbi:hypothetical protein HY418_00535 [Candidatus Kaiserbacteria bacterium]|nr:hypothetical protein [Candidatus Kaiserbacteria bacterium]
MCWLATLLSSAIAMAVVDIPPAAPRHERVIPPPFNPEWRGIQIVEGWILCSTQEQAEVVLHARTQDFFTATMAYIDLAATKKCGNVDFLYISRPEVVKRGGVNGTVYRTEIYLYGQWPKAFLVSPSQ